jgi:hypothetical protein
MILTGLGEVCFRRCIVSYEKEYLSTGEQSCVDRCAFKYDQMIREVFADVLK